MSDGNPDFTLLRVARLIDGGAGRPVERGAILMRGGEIVAAGPEERVVPPEGAPVNEVHYEDKTALPGLVDCHVHLTGFGDGRSGDELATLPDELLTLQAARNAAAHLRSGVTTVRDCGAKNRTTFMLRSAYDMGIAAGPRLSLAGRPLAIVGGHLSYFGIAATGEIECRAHVRQLVKEGADFIKVTATGGSTRTSFPTRPSFSPDELAAIVEEAHSFGKHTVAHCASTQGMVNALDAGIDTIVHGMFVEPDGSWLYRPELAERIARQAVFVNPTIHNGRGRMLELEARRGASGLSDGDQAELDGLRRRDEERLSAFAAMRDAGVRLVCGSDSAWSEYAIGGFQHEVATHVEGGMSPSEAILSATSASARSCWLDGEVGTLEPGKRADVLVVDGDPTQDVGALWNVADVYLDGERVERGGLA